MILELAHLKVKPGSATLFEAAVTEAVPLFQRARGCVSMQLQRSEEQPEEYFLIVGWETLNDHTVHFRDSEDFQQWRRLVGPFFLQPPTVRHLSQAVAGF